MTPTPEIELSGNSGELPTPEAADIAGLVEELNAWAPFVASGYECPAASKAMHRAATALQSLSAELAEAKANPPHPAWVADFLNRRTEVENWLRAPAQAQRKGRPVPSAPTPDEMERWANRLGIPSEVAAYSAQPESFAGLHTSATTAEAEARAMREALEANEKLLLIRSVRAAAEAAAPLWLEHADSSAIKARALGGTNAE